LSAGEVTRMYESNRRSLAAIEDNRVILAQAGIHCLAANDAGFSLERERRQT